MSDQNARGLTPDELAAQSGEQLPDREVMSLVTPDPEGRLAMDLVDSGGAPPPSNEYAPPPITE